MNYNPGLALKTGNDIQKIDTYIQASKHTHAKQLEYWYQNFNK